MGPETPKFYSELQHKIAEEIAIKIIDGDEYKKAFDQVLINRRITNENDVRKLKNLLGDLIKEKIPEIKKDRWQKQDVEDEINREKKIDAELNRQISGNEHIISPDGEDLDFKESEFKDNLK